MDGDEIRQSGHSSFTDGGHALQGQDSDLHHLPAAGATICRNLARSGTVVAPSIPVNRTQSENKKKKKKKKKNLAKISDCPEWRTELWADAHCLSCRHSISPSRGRVQSCHVHCTPSRGRNIVFNRIEVRYVCHYNLRLWSILCDASIMLCH